jgi:XTP/dITP diphosphohydrolase
MYRLTLATRNAHKTREFSEILGPGFLVTDLSRADEIPEIEETGRTFEANAILKAVAAAHCVPGLVISDDSGLEVAALQGAPGVRSARYAGEHSTDRENIAKLLSELRRIDPAALERGAGFHCVLALAEAGKLLRTFHGTVPGSIVPEPRGNGGFGYDPIFVPENHAETFAELGETVKNRISHRARAIAQLRSYFAD